MSFPRPWPSSLLLANTLRPLRTLPPPRSSRTIHTPPNLSGLNCVITGASRGIGHAIASHFASLKASCFLVGRDRTTLSAAASSLTASLTRPKFTPDINYVVIPDVASAASWEEIAKACPRPHIVVNAAGVSQNRVFLRTSEEEWDKVLDTNLTGTMMGCRYAARQMLRMKNGGVIINVSSLLAVRGGKGAVAYAASKAGVLGLTRALAEELGPKGIRVNAIVPGYIETDMTAAMNPAVVKSVRDRIPLQRFGTVDEVAEAAVFLATNKYANNCDITLDGGMSAALSDPPKGGSSQVVVPH
ncbi:hypothetical protein H2201_002312 [Coniosporium apollinis]|uniref:Ketoreductase domain-containing protein n=1 Tax=Coniosporium apollinis TaxID=61459 RepID=A0ABQ9P1M6_9PEZI|nr:hypothetical protein H2201_002312 [Coniosporium apollinis]